MTPPYNAIVHTPLGHLGILLEENQLTSIEFLSADFAPFISENLVARAVAEQLEHYFQEPQFGFTVPFTLKGTAFQSQVWERLTKIPAGKTESYGSLAKELETSPRAIGQACRHNPLPIIIPCHRVLANKALGGFFGQTQGDALLRKQWLLHHESITFKNNGKT